jgi:hypothetical protein
MEVVKEGQNSETEGMTLPSLIASYRTDVDSPYRKLRFHTRQHYDTLCKRGVS